MSKLRRRTRRKKVKVSTVAFWISLAAALITIAVFVISMTPGLFIGKEWDFKIVRVEPDKSRAFPGEGIEIRVVVENTGYRPLATCYGVVKIAYAYNHEDPVFDSHRDLPLDKARKLRIVDIEKGNNKDFRLYWKIPSDLSAGIYDIGVEIWNPALLYGESDRKLFDATDWNAHLEIQERLSFDYY